MACNGCSNGGVCRRSELTIERKNSAQIRTRVRVPIKGVGVDTHFYSFSGLQDNLEHIAVEVGAPNRRCPLVRVHSECLTGDIFQSLRCDCGDQLGEALSELTTHGGFILYLRQEGRGIGLYRKLEAYGLQDQGYDTFEANRQLNLPEDARTYDVAIEMLLALGIRNVQLMTNNSDKVRGLKEGGIDVESVIPTGNFCNVHNANYLQAKADRDRRIAAAGTIE